MAVQINNEARALLEAPNFCHLATLMPDGSPHVTPVWVDIEGDQILINSAEGRVKTNNMRRDPRVGLSVTSVDNPYQFVSIRGRVVEVTSEGALEHIDKVTMKYLNQDKYPFAQPGEVRVLFKIEAENVFVTPPVT